MRTKPSLPRRRYCWIIGLVGLLHADKAGAGAVGGLLVGLIASVAVFFTSEYGRQLVAFGRDSWREVKKVVWPARKESMQMTAYVFAFVLLMAIFLWLPTRPWNGLCMT